MNRIQVGLASFGMSGKVFHAPILTHHPGFRVSRIVERSKNEVKNTYPEITSVRSFDELLDDDNIELVVVNTPDHTHFEYARKALEAGKHVIVEKPFTRTIGQGEDLLNLAERKNRMLSIFQNRRWDGDFLTVRQLIGNGWLGRLVEFESNYMRYRNYIQPDTWKESAIQGIGITYNLGSHMIDQAITLFGMPDAVWADIDSMRTGSEIDDYYIIKLIYPEIKAVLKASYLVREEGPRYTLHGAHGSFLKYGIDPQEEMLKRGGNPSMPDWGKEPEDRWGILNTEINGVHIRGKVETVAGNYAAFYDNIYDVLRNRAEPEVSPGQALNVILLIEAAMESSRNGQSVEIGSCF
ncbi:MAG: oxidoreductase [Bacteroidales bacterium]|jgi:predicted dehydrogenase|nr:oxidoreductase [Bacteroidales bacterium]